ncbi:hypothetical protein B5M42_021715 [Paenibacillus athensensis]|nr:hypothetical protein [Paenibacillus athensensis]MCD1261423.1 hypothetical protein [Paenibacillus athensensis]
MTYNARITAIGSYVPSHVLDNAEPERRQDTSDEWIVRRTGIRERRIAAVDEFTSDMCVKAVEDLLGRYPVSVQDVEMILVATYTPDFPTPSVACLLQHRMGIAATGALDLNAACIGFVYGLHVAHDLIASGLHRKVLVLGADTASKIVNYSDRTMHSLQPMRGTRTEHRAFAGCPASDVFDGNCPPAGFSALSVGRVTACGANSAGENVLPFGGQCVYAVSDLSAHGV